MGSLLLAGGSPKCQLALPNVTIMLHQPSGGAEGMASNLKIQAENMLETQQQLNLLYHYHTKKLIHSIEQVMDRDTFMDTKQAMDFGIIDKILQKRGDEQRLLADKEGKDTN